MKRPIILHIISDLGIGGAEKQLLLLLPTLQSSYDNRVVCLRGPALTGKALVDKDIPVTYLNRKLPFSPGIFLSITKTINKLKPDIVVGYLVEADVISRFACHNKNVAYVSSQRSSLVHHPFLASLNKTTKRLADFFTVHTRARKTELINSWKISPSKIFIIPNTVITPPTNKNNLVPTDNSLNIICVANFKKGKGHSLLLKAFNNLHKQHPNIRLLLMGKGPLEKPLRRQISEYASRQHIRFLGQQESVWSHLAAADIFVLPTEGEGMSNALLEAMNMGLPCLTSDIKANQELIHNQENGLLYKNRNLTSLISQLDALISNHILRERLAQNAKTYTENNHSLNKVSNLWNDLFHSILNR